MIDVTLLGTSGTFPLPDRPLSALLARIGSELMLFDCGEGTQVGMRRAGWGLKNLSTICLSHLHADHVSGLPGLLLTVGHAGRTEPLDIFGPVNTGIVVAGLRVIARRLPFEVRVHEITDAITCGEGALPNGAVLSALAVEHSTPCLAYKVEMRRSRPFLPERARALGVPVEVWKTLQRGEPVPLDGQTIVPADVLGPDRPGLSFAYVTDTRPTPAMPAFLADTDLLVIEGTYGDPEDAENAREKRHMLFSEAAEVGRQARARALWLTHFSAKVLDPWQYARHATDVFPATTIGYEGLTTQLRFRDEPTPSGRGVAAPA